MDIPPNTMLYDCRQRKRKNKTQSNPTFPSIHVHNHLPGSSARIDTGRYDVVEISPPTSPAPPPTVVKRRMSTPPQEISCASQLNPQSIIDLTNSDDDDDNEGPDGIQYPDIPVMLNELHGEYPALRFPQYEEILAGNGFVYINQLVEEEEARGQLESIGIPMGVVNLLLSRAGRLMRRTQKLKQEY